MLSEQAGGLGRGDEEFKAEMTSEFKASLSALSPDTQL